VADKAAAGGAAAGAAARGALLGPRSPRGGDVDAPGAGGAAAAAATGVAAGRRAGGGRRARRRGRALGRRQQRRDRRRERRRLPVDALHVAHHVGFLGKALVALWAHKRADAVVDRRGVALEVKLAAKGDAALATLEGL